MGTNLNLKNEIIENPEKLLRNHGRRRLSGQMNLNYLADEVCDAHWRRYAFIITLWKYWIKSENGILLVWLELNVMFCWFNRASISWDRLVEEMSRFPNVRWISNHCFNCKSQKFTVLRWPAFVFEWPFVRRRSGTRAFPGTSNVDHREITACKKKKSDVYAHRLFLQVG